MLPCYYNFRSPCDEKSQPKIVKIYLERNLLGKNRYQAKCFPIPSECVLRPVSTNLAIWTTSSAVEQRCKNKK